MAAGDPRWGAGGLEGCSWPQPGVRAPAPVPPRVVSVSQAQLPGAAWRRARPGSGSRQRRQQLCVSESPGRFVTYADVQASYRYKPNQWSYFKQFCKPYVNSPHKVRMWHCYNHIKGIPGSDLTVSRTGFQRDFRVYLQLRQTWAWLKSVLNSTANSDTTKYPLPWSFA
ncbi:choline transporter-like protein 5-A isoform X1 [Lathamus discolor]|uniref:choline transporter-like protein 5-A isoform X1 n=1 Tax=Lathamus discolor TaxID=678569 RepID=UPI0032B79534